MSDEEFLSGARQTFHTIMEISNSLNTGLDAETLTYCVRLIETGIHPQLLADLVKFTKREVEEIKQKKRSNNFDKGFHEAIEK